MPTYGGWEPPRPDPARYGVPGPAPRAPYGHYQPYQPARLGPRPPIRRIPEHVFWRGARPAAREPIMHRTARVPFFLALMLTGIGLYGVVIGQLMVMMSVVLHPFIVIVIGAPVFEEALKFGVALLLVSFLMPTKPWQSWLASVVRVPVALAVGAAFGWFEHWYSYSQEGELERWMRIIFHGGATGLSMMVYTVLETVRDRRARWLSLAPAVFLHWLNNFTALPVGIVAELTAPVLAVVWFGGIAVSFVLIMVAAVAGARPLRRWAARVVQQRFPRLVRDEPATTRSRDAAGLRTPSP